MGVPGEKEREKVAERTFEELMAKRSPNLMQTINLQIQEAHKFQVE